MEYVFLGYGKFDAATNMAYDEAMLNRVESDKRVFIRFHDFTKPSLILAKRESIDDVYAGRCADLGFDINRRLSHGSVILCHPSVLSYSIASPYHDPTSAHNEFGKKIAYALKELGIENVGVGSHFSVRIDGRTVAGHGQRYRPGKALLYHGVMAVDPWDAALVDSVIKLRPAPSEGARTELEILQELPAVRNYADVSKQDVARKILESLTGGNYKHMNIEELYPEASRLIETKYSTDLWVQNARLPHETSPLISKDQGFCFIDILAPEGTVEMV